MSEKESKKSQSDFVFSFFVDHPNEDLTTASVVEWATDEWLRINSARLKDPDRAIRKLAELGLIQKLANGLYRYTPEHIVAVEDRPKSKRQKLSAGEKSRSCAACGLGSATETAVEPVRISDSSPATMLLCRSHADMYRRTGALDLCTNLFTALANEARSRGDQDLIDLCNQVLANIRAFNVAHSN